MDPLLTAGLTMIFLRETPLARRFALAAGFC